MRRVCVFCGSSPGARPVYAEATAELARRLVADGIGVVYGGGALGMMGVLADTVMAACTTRHRCAASLMSSGASLTNSSGRSRAPAD